ncbi:hypothetical protein LLS1_29100 [Leifsonia sp. LS1]|nr:hypothetical protein LLS1_29100 [Leifsonia sp. LS1]
MSAENGKRTVDAEKVLRCVCLVVVTMAKLAHLAWTVVRG